MSKTSKIAIIAAFAAFLILFAGAAIASAAPNTTTNTLSYEFDNGSTWTLQQNTAALKSTYANPNYSDAGIVVDLGPASDFTGIAYTGTGSLSANIWIGDGSEAYTPGTHSLSETADFSYGFQQSDGSFWMTSGSYAGQTLTPADIASDFSGNEVYAWIGVVYDGTDSVTGSITSVNGHSVGNRTASFTNNGDGTVTALIH